jgi:cytochrome c
MNSFELNKVLGAVLGTCLVLLAINLGANALFATEPPAKPGYKIVVAQAQTGKAEPKKQETPLPVLLAHASVDKGKQIARQCEACHTLGKGEPNKVGPNLYNVVGAPVAEGRGGFGFSAALKKKGGKWTYDKLFEWLKDPRGYAPGTLMTFAGIQNPQQRADVIAYLRTLSPNPEPLPKVEAQPKPAAAPAKSGGAENGQKKAAAPAADSLKELFAKASIATGKQTARQCEACHSLGKGEPNRVGPNLYNVVGAPVAEGRNGYNFSAALKKKGGKWTYEKLFEWLKNPRAYAPGTLMTFAGIDNPQRRMDVIAYLRTLSDNPVPPPQ